MLLQRIRELQVFRQRKTRLVIAVFLLLFAGLIIKAALPNAVYRYEGSHLFTEGEAAADTVVYEEIALSPGVYYVELEFESDTDLSALCTLRDGTVIRGGLLTNGEHLYAGNDRTGYHMWLYEGTEHLQVVVSYGGKGYLQTGNLTITETDQLWTMLMVVLFFVTVLIMAGIIYWEYERKYGVALWKKQAFFFVALTALIASVPCLYGSMLGGADLTYHLQRIEGCKDGILSGQFPVRLEPEWLYGHGYANGIFYCNALLYLPALLRLAGFTVTASYNIYCVLLNVATAWIAWYCFGKIYKNSVVGLVCGALYTLSIFRVYKLFCCGAVGEGSAYTFLPLVLYGLYRAFTEDPREKSYRTVWLPVGLGYAGLLQTHVLTCEITALVTVMICLVCIRRVFCRETFLELLKGALAAAGLSLWYLVPFLDYYVTQDVHIKHVSARSIQERGLGFVQMLTGWPGEDQDAIGVGVILALGLCIFLALWLGGFLRGRVEKGVKLAKLSAVFGIALMLMSLSVFPWNAIQNINGLSASLVSSLQFPNRFLGWAVVFLTAVYGCVLCCLRDKEPFFRIGIAAAVVGIVVTGGHQTDVAMKEQSTLQLYNEEGMGFGYISGAEYLIQDTDYSLLTFRGPLPGENVRLDSYRKKYLQVEMNCSNGGADEGAIDLPLLLYKGYRACDRSTGRALEVRDGENHVVRVILPGGFSGEVLVRFVSPVYWRLAELVSVLAAFSVIVFWRAQRRAKA